MAQPKANLLKKIEFQILRTIGSIPIDEEKVEMAQSLLNSLIDTGDTILDSEMPATLFGATLDWSAGAANDLIVDISAGAFNVEQELGTANIAFTETIDTTSPGEVTGLTPTIGSSYISLSWTNPIDTDFDHVEIWYGAGNTNTQFMGTINSADTTIEGLASDVEYTLLVKTVDTTGNISTGVSINATPAATLM